MHQYRVLLRVLATCVAFGLGIAVAWTLRERPPAAAPWPKVSAVVGLASASTRTTQKAPKPTANQDANSRQPAVVPKTKVTKPPQASADSNHKVKVPIATAKSADDDTDLLPRAPTSTVTLELAKAGLHRVTIRQGSLERDGPSQHSKWVRSPSIAALSGTQVRVRVLHYGYDSDGEVTALHVQTLDEPSKQGMVNLLPKGKRIPLSH
ncbi:MAG TPA: hypothetical protein DCQ06_07835 [Myxococcales bacterium]|nr:hypothetical protein [Myxococcales bacterium]